MSSEMRLGLAFLIGLAATSHAAAAGLKPAMRAVVTCVYDMVRSHTGVLSTDVYAIGQTEYIVEYKFRGKAGAIFIGGLGIYDIVKNGSYAYANEPPSGQPDHDGQEDLDFLGNAMLDDMVTRCHVMPTLMDMFVLPGTPPDPPREKIDMSAPEK